MIAQGGPGERFLPARRGVTLTPQERAALEAGLGAPRQVGARQTIIRAGENLDRSTLLLDGVLSRFLDDRKGLRQLVAVHFAGDFVDLHGFALKVLDHDIATMTPVTVATVSHAYLQALFDRFPDLSSKLWFATLTDAAIHRAWLFRLGRLDAVGRVAHFLAETNARLVAAGLSDGHVFSLGLIQADVAEICGLTQVHVNRVLRQLREERLCTFRSSLVEIPSPARLAARGQFNPAYLYLDPAVERVSLAA